jgi:hypothetical protein
MRLQSVLRDVIGVVAEFMVRVGTCDNASAIDHM